MFTWVTYLNCAGFAPGPNGTFLRFDQRGTSHLVDSNGDPAEWGRNMGQRSLQHVSRERFVDVSGQKVFEYKAGK